jgi:hypothetical protein
MNVKWGLLGKVSGERGKEKVVEVSMIEVDSMCV